MNFGQAISSGFRNYVNFSDRSSRSEYWYWVLFAVLLNIVTRIVDAGIGGPVTGSIVGLLLFLPGLAVAVRRLHDIDRSGWWILLVFTVIGILVLIYWYVQPGTPEPNRFGQEPLKA
jgi:uncharacterized membrane protein YhaH (DUF805 family)